MKEPVPSGTKLKLVLPLTKSLNTPKGIWKMPPSSPIFIILKPAFSKTNLSVLTVKKLM